MFIAPVPTKKSPFFLRRLRRAKRVQAAKKESQNI